jgi:hypothetical protein
MAHRKGKGLPVKIHGGAAVMGAHAATRANPKWGKKSAGLKSRGRKVRKVGSGRM